MKDTLATSGVPSVEELRATPGFPLEDALATGALAVIECLQEIPCDPCEAACPRGAITIGERVTNLPALDVEKCDGCGACIAACPGLAIFVVDNTYSDQEAEVSLPWEYLPAPEKGQVVEAVNRRGEVVCRGRVSRVRNALRQDRTAVVSLVIPRAFSGEVRGMKVRRAAG